MEPDPRPLAAILFLLALPAPARDLTGLQGDLKYRTIEFRLLDDKGALLRDPSAYGYCADLQLLSPYSAQTEAVQKFVNVWREDLNAREAEFTWRIPRCDWKVLAVGRNGDDEPVVLQANVDSSADRTGDRAVRLAPSDSRVKTLAGEAGTSQERLFFRPAGYPIYLGVALPSPRRDVRVHFRLGGKVDLFAQGRRGTDRFLFDYGPIDADGTPLTLSFADRDRQPARFRHESRLSVTAEERPVTVRWARTRVPGLGGELILPGSRDVETVWVSPGVFHLGYERRVRGSRASPGDKDELFRVGFSQLRYDLSAGGAEFRLNQSMEAQLLAFDTSRNTCPRGGALVEALHCVDSALADDEEGALRYSRTVLGRLLVADSNGHPLNRLADASGEILDQVSARLDPDGDRKGEWENLEPVVHYEQRRVFDSNSSRLLFKHRYGDGSFPDLSGTQWLIRVPVFGLWGWYAPLIDLHRGHADDTSRPGPESGRVRVDGRYFLTVVPRVMGWAATRVLADFDEVTGRMAEATDLTTWSRIYFHTFLDDANAARGGGFMRMPMHIFQMDDVGGRNTVAHEASHNLGFWHGGAQEIVNTLGLAAEGHPLSAQYVKWNALERVNDRLESGEVTVAKDYCYSGLFYLGRLLGGASFERLALRYESPIRVALGATNSDLDDELPECVHPRHQAVTLALLRLSTGSDFFAYAHDHYGNNADYEFDVPASEYERALKDVYDRWVSNEAMARDGLVPLYPIPLDVDGNGRAEPLTDGLLVTRFLFGVRGTSLVSGAVGTNAFRTTGPAVAAYLEGLPSGTLDVDANGAAEPLTDGVLVTRYLFGVRGTALTSGATGTGAQRSSPASVEGYLSGLVSP